MKKSWQAPALETLDVGMTMAGTGTRNVDWVFVGGKPQLNLTDDPKWNGYPAPPLS
ncbi:paeninodin family lasso peptide [Cohnella sp. REN36]|uniref:paeninodin family lasso peptide n=1 Tax=Cohnella sp. REN36 TaxID=2887347 RepID=UPI00351D94CA